MLLVQHALPPPEKGARSMAEMDPKEVGPDDEPEKSPPEVELQVADTEQPTGKPQRPQGRVLGDLNAFSIHSSLHVVGSDTDDRLAKS